MAVTFREFARSEVAALADVLTSSRWPYHAGDAPTRVSVLESVAAGYYDGETVRTFWIIDSGERVGFVRLDDLGDSTPMFDLRIRDRDRGRGLGTVAVGWLTAYLFNELGDIRRIEATTRQDNLAMRRVLRRCGYVKESHYRRAWPAADGTIYDSIGYAVLRTDWATGTLTPPDWDDEAPRSARA